MVSSRGSRVRTIVGVASVGLMAIAGCGSGENSGASGGRPIEVGYTNALSGPYAAIGEPQKVGFDAAIQAVNRSGGVNDRPIEVTYLDDGNTPARASANAIRLVTQGQVVAVAGNVGADACTAVMPIGTQNSTPVLCANGPDNGSADPYTFLTTASADFFARPMFDFTKTLLAGKPQPRVGIVALTTGSVAAWTENIDRITTDAGWQTRIESVDPAAANAAAQMRTIAGFEPDAVLVVDTEPHLTQLLQALDSAGRPDVPVIAFGNVPSTALLESRRSPSLYNINDFRIANASENQPYRDAMTAIGADPNRSDGRAGFLQALALVQGLERCGADCTGESLQASLDSLRITTDGLTPAATLAFAPGRHRLIGTATVTHFDPATNGIVEATSGLELGAGE